MRPLSTFLFAILMFLGMTTLLSCQDSLFYSEYRAIPNSQWDSSDTVSFQLPETESPFDATMTICVRARHDYDYKDIVLRYEHLVNDSIVSADTLNITLYDADEHPISHAFSVSDNSSRPLPLHMERNERHALRITHTMRLNPLQGISDVGVSVERK